MGERRISMRISNRKQEDKQPWRRPEVGSSSGVKRKRKRKTEDSPSDLKSRPVEHKLKSEFKTSNNEIELSADSKGSTLPQEFCPCSKCKQLEIKSANIKEKHIEKYGIHWESEQSREEVKSSPATRSATQRKGTLPPQAEEVKHLYITSVQLERRIRPIVIKEWSFSKLWSQISFRERKRVVSLIVKKFKQFKNVSEDLVKVKMKSVLQNGRKYALSKIREEFNNCKLYNMRKPRCPLEVDQATFNALLPGELARHRANGVSEVKREQENMPEVQHKVQARSTSGHILSKKRKRIVLKRWTSNSNNTISSNCDRRYPQRKGRSGGLSTICVENDTIKGEDSVQIDDGCCQMRNNETDSRELTHMACGTSSGSKLTVQNLQIPLLVNSRLSPPVDPSTRSNPGSLWDYLAVSGCSQGASSSGGALEEAEEYALTSGLLDHPFMGCQVNTMEECEDQPSCNSEVGAQVPGQWATVRICVPQVRLGCDETVEEPHQCCGQQYCSLSRSSDDEDFVGDSSNWKKIEFEELFSRVKGKKIAVDHPSLKGRKF